MTKESVNTAKNKKLLLTLGIAGVIILAIIIALLLVPKQDKFEYEGWINCQPILSKEEAELCKRAEAAEYPYIAY